MHGATSVCLWPRSGNKDKLASSPSDDDEHSAQWDACDIWADNKSAEAKAVRVVDQLSLVPMRRVKPGLVSPSGQRRRKWRKRETFQEEQLQSQNNEWNLKTSTEQDQHASQWVHL